MHLYIRFLDRTNSEKSEQDFVVEWSVDPLGEHELSRDTKQLTDFVGVHEEFRNPANVTVIAPSEDALWVQCKVPGRSASQIRRALPFAVEEFVADEIEENHIAYGSITRGERVDCIAVSKDVIRSWLGFLAELGVTPGRLVIDGMLVPNDFGKGTVLVDSESVHLRTETELVVVHRSDLSMVTDLIPDIEGPEDRITVLAESESVIREIGLSAESVRFKRVRKPLMPFFIEQINDRAINILQSEFAPVSSYENQWLKWRSVVGLAVFWAAVTILLMLGEGFWARGEFTDVRAESVALYRSIYNEQRVPGNPASTMRRRVGQVSSETVGFQNLMATLAVTIRDAVPDAVLSAVSYTESRQSLSLDIIVSSFDRLDVLKRSLEDKDLLVELPTAEQQGESVRARIRLGGKSI